ncbi:MAG TPA: transaldolase [Anaerolineae bacterium]|nr:transaldolase [Anaerolineae bacterium]
MTSKLQRLYDEFGQSIWLDFISRDIMASGQFQELIDLGLRGVTSNPSIFNKAISGSALYDEDIRRLAGEGADAFAIYDVLSQADITAACDALLPLYESSNRGDGYVSIEVNPDLAYDAEGTVAEAQRLWRSIDRPNLMVKVPATREGIPAIRRLIAAGVNVNATLMFSLRHYEAVAYAFIEGVEDRARAGEDVSHVASVASFFVSRIDTAVDKALAAVGNTELQGKIAIANAKLAYDRFKVVFGDARWQALANQGARVQRPLWASTSTKNPAYSDVLYVENLIGPHTVNTLPLHTIQALLDHGRLARTVDQGVEEARAQIARLAELGIDFDQITEDLQTAGVKAFANDFHKLLHTIAQRAGAIASV